MKATNTSIYDPYKQPLLLHVLIPGIIFLFLALMTDSKGLLIEEHYLYSFTF